MAWYWYVLITTGYVFEFIILSRLILWVALKGLNKLPISKDLKDEDRKRFSLLENSGFNPSEKGWDEPTSNSVGSEFGSNPSGINPSGVSWIAPPEHRRVLPNIKRRNQIRRKLKGRNK